MKKNIKEVKKVLAANKEELKEKFGVKRIGIFGSYARGEQTGKSDLDVLIELNRTIGLFRLMDLQDHLRRLVGIKVDLVTKESLKPIVKGDILREAVYV